MVYVKPPYVDWPGDLFVVAAWTAAWGLAHALLDRGFLVPLANSLFKAKTDADISLPPAGTRKKMKSAVTASPSDNQKAAKPSDDAKAVMRIRQKFIYSGWKCFAYSLSTAVGVVVLSEDNFWGVVVHHIATLSVMAASYAFGFTRIGVIILLLHDCSDPFMEFAKCNLYMGKQKVG
ncbi:Ceramide synthase 3 [Entophlyctis sp. JEL0112]|nr:Ceramide synthase 3 [Entophlyctis sp. JEL0112]